MATVLPCVADSLWWPCAEGRNTVSSRRRARLRRTAILQSLQKGKELQVLLSSGVEIHGTAYRGNVDAEAFSPSGDSDTWNQHCFNVLMGELGVVEMAGVSTCVQKDDGSILHQHPERIKFQQCQQCGVGTRRLCKETLSAECLPLVAIPARVSVIDENVTDSDHH